MLFEWDESKNRANILDHGIELAFGKLVFKDKQVLDFADERFDYGEERRVAIGKVARRYVVTVYTMRAEVCRLISVRFATAKERGKYDEYCANDI
ncbi:MAG: BrnT family toxin [Candidatus Margulisbacteria bacterium]|nr:BrnT family toxin [Candidatus Margulisiibacteriota bacterium]